MLSKTQGLLLFEEKLERARTMPSKTQGLLLFEEKLERARTMLSKTQGLLLFEERLRCLGNLKQVGVDCVKVWHSVLILRTKHNFATVGGKPDKLKS